jgi:hypothetical protein
MVPLFAGPLYRLFYTTLVVTGIAFVLVHLALALFVWMGGRRLAIQGHFPWYRGNFEPFRPQHPTATRVNLTPSSVRPARMPLHP